MRIQLITISKPEEDGYEMLVTHFMKLSQPFAKFSALFLFNKEIAAAHKESQKASREAYAKALTPHLKGCTIALTPEGKSVDTEGFARVLKDQGDINFFIGGAYGFGSEFLSRCTHAISLSPLTFSHKIAKVVAAEQIYRALTLLNNHPYHK